MIYNILNNFIKTKYKLLTTIAVGSIIYGLILILLYTKLCDNINNISLIKKYIYYIPVIDIIILLVINKVFIEKTNDENHNLIQNKNELNNTHIFKTYQDDETDIELPIYKP